MKTAIKVSESQIQSAFFGWIRWMALQDERYDYFLKIPNEGKRSWGYAGKLKKEGLRAGVPDLLCLWPMSHHPGFALEFKTERGKLTEVQERWRQRLLKAGWSYYIVRSSEEAMEKTKEYFLTK